MTRHTAGASSNGEAAVKQHDGGAIICLISINGVKKREKEKRGGKCAPFYSFALNLFMSILNG